jgi:type II secretory pathway component PulF
MEQTSSRANLAPAIDALARELPLGRRRAELNSLARSLQKQAAVPEGDSVAGTSSVGEMLELVARQSKLRTQENKTWLYPCFLTLLMCVFFLFISPLILQPFAVMFDEFGLALPSITKFVLYVGTDIFGSPSRLLILGLTAICGGYVIYWMVSRMLPLSRGFYRIFAGNNGNVAAMAKILGAFAHRLSSGIALPDALAGSAESCGNLYLRRATLGLAEQLRTDSGPLQRTPEALAFPQNMLDAIRPVDGSPPNIALLHELSLIYEERCDLRDDYIGGAMGVMSVLAVGILVLIIVLALFAPLISLVSGLT